VVVFDTTALLLFINPNCPPPNDPKTGVPVTRCRDRVEFLVKTLSEARVKIGIPTPVLAEYLIGVGPKKQEYLTQFLSNSAFLPLPFDEKSAVELALCTESGVKLLDIKAKVRFDRQVVAIAKTNAATALYTGDENQAVFARTCGVNPIMIWEIPLPPPQTAPLFGPEAPPESIDKAKPATSSPNEPPQPS
jgi:hypothetical protein